MNILKQILHYLIWTFVSFLCGFGYIRMILGPIPSTGFMKNFEWIYILVIQHVGLLIGSGIALLFILVDVFYLKKKLENDSRSRSIPIRFLVIISITFILGTIHYICEKVIDII